MKVTLLEESGIRGALLGLGLSYGKTLKITKDKTLLHDWYDKVYQSKEVYNLGCKMGERATKLALKGNGHNEFLKHCTIQFLIVAPNYWWKHFDQYKIGCVDLSSSIMHNALDRDLTQDDFEYHIPETYIELLSQFRNQVIDKRREFEDYISLIPEGYLYTRVVTMNYMTLQNIIKQRKNHKLSQWRVFCKEVLEQIAFPEWIE